MSDEPIEPNGIHIFAAGLLTFGGIFVAIAGWMEALNLNIERSILYARPGQPIESGWQPIAVGVVTIFISGSIAVGVLHRGFSEKAARLFLVLLLLGSIGWIIFGLAGIAVGIQSFPLLAESGLGVQ